VRSGALGQPPNCRHESGVVWTLLEQHASVLPGEGITKNIFAAWWFFTFCARSTQSAQARDGATIAKRAAR